MNVRHTTSFLLFLTASIIAGGQELSIESRNLAPLPIPVTNNAVTTVISGGKQFVISFAGLAKGKSFDDTLDVTFVLETENERWTQADPVPGGVGRLAATATAVGGLAYVFGGYSVAADTSEISTPWVHAFDPVTMTFYERQNMPVPVDDSLSVPYRNRYIYLISGWHDDTNVDLVQRYDTETDEWDQATPIPGATVFGHAGGIVGNRIVYCDGVAIRTYPDGKREFAANNECFIGIIDEENGRRIDWHAIEPHPGAPRYRMASAGLGTGNAVLFIGGSENPYNYDGIGYDGEPSLPVAGALLFDLEKYAWTIIPQRNTPTMDHRGLAQISDQWVTVGGMLNDQEVTRRVIAYTLAGVGPL